MSDLLSTIIIAVFLVYVFSDEENEMRAQYKTNLEKTIVIDQDTLTIIDYSYVFSNYGLSNGATISAELAHKKYLDQ